MKRDLEFVDQEGRRQLIDFDDSQPLSIQVEPGMSLDFMERSGGGGGAAPSFRSVGNDLVVNFPGGAEVRLIAFASASGAKCPVKVTHNKQPVDNLIQQTTEDINDENEDTEDDGAVEAKPTKPDSDRDIKDGKPLKPPTKDKIVNKAKLVEPDGGPENKPKPLKLQQKIKLAQKPEFEPAFQEENIEFGRNNIAANGPSLIKVMDANAVEAAGQIIFTLIRENNLGQFTRVAFNTAELDPQQNAQIATEGVDFTGRQGEVIFKPGEKVKQIVIELTDDQVFEPEESFKLEITPVENAVVNETVVKGTINNDADKPQIAVANVQVQEGAGNVIITFNKIGQTLLPSTVTFNVQGGTATAGQDFTVVSGTVNFTPSQTVQQVVIPILQDNLSEVDETFVVNLTDPTEATLNQNQVVVTIQDDDPLPALSVDDVTVNESAATATFTVSLSAPSGQTVTVDVATIGITALSGDDFNDVLPTTLTFNPGDTTQTVVVTLLPDTIDEPATEFFHLNLSNPSNATIADGQGIGNITDDDPQPTISINDVTVNESAGTATFTISLSGASSFPISVDVASADGTATGGVDYGVINPTTINFAPGQTLQTVVVPLIDDAIDEADTETFQLNLSNAVNATIADGVGVGSITDDEPQPMLVLDNLVVDEEAGVAEFVLKLSEPSARAITVDVVSADITAIMGTDYTPANATITFLPGELTQTVSVPILPDGMAEPNELFRLDLTNESNVTLSNTSALATIVDNSFTVINGIPLVSAGGGRMPISAAGDINGDGFADIVIGQPYRHTIDGEGYVIFGRGDDIPTPFEASNLLPANGGDGSEGFILRSNPNLNGIGYSVSVIRDINGDGFDDVVITQQAGSNPSKAYVIFGHIGAFSAEFVLADLETANGGDGTEGIVFNGDVGDISKFVVSSAGDLNGDGLEDLIIGAPDASAGSIAYVVFGNPIGLPEFDLSTLRVANGGDGSAGFALIGEGSGDGAGMAVSSAGDINGDGLDDLIVGAFMAGTGGRAYVVFGNAVGNPPPELGLSSLLAANGGDGSLGIVINGNAAGDDFGYSVSSAGDINGDGFDDFIIGAPRATPDGRTNSGEVYVLFGGASGPGAEFNVSDLFAINGGDGTMGFVVKGVLPGDSTGASVAGAGDINGDGFDDIVIGAPDADPSGQADAGVVTVIFGRPTGSFSAEVDISSLGPIDGFNVDGIAPGDHFGSIVSGVGDINGDGLEDIGFSAPEANGGDGLNVIVYGRNFTDFITLRGVDGNDVLQGDIGLDSIIGGLGDDTLISLGGLDILRGGGGNDLIRIQDGGFFKLDGGSGTDRIEFDADTLALDFNLIAPNAVKNIEEIDITGVGNNTLRLNPLDIIDITDSNNTLTVFGDSGDRIESNLVPAGYVNSGSAGGFTTYTNGISTLVVQDTIDQTMLISL